MQMTRTTLRLRQDLKKAAEILAVQQGRTLQDIFNQALELQLRQAAAGKAKQIAFADHDLGVAVDNLRREDYYS